MVQVVQVVQRLFKGGSKVVQFKKG